MKVINITNQKGGIGKGTIATNLAYGLSVIGKNILLIEGDEQGDSSSIVLKEGTIISEKEIDNIEEEIKNSSFFNALNKCLIPSQIKLDYGDVLCNPEKINDAIISTEYERIDVLPATIRSTEASVAQRLMADVTRSPIHRMKEALTYIPEGKYDYVIIDNKPLQGYIVTNNLVASNLNIIPVKVDRGSIKGFMATIKNMLALEKNNNLNFEFKVLFTMVNRNNSEKFITELFRTNIPDFVYETEINYQAKPLANCSLENKILLENNMNTKVEQRYQSFVDEFCRDEGIAGSIKVE
ncbi:ParA family protein [Breznakia pachnodae]|uniref:Chromosome partitioning protein n=1 Tax=Breznakia pachnodae TaxID=265178 RepID=A0ABU0E3X0_9FIRM|nr:AAA family ATPase [Breznakia pachnodae]MDQ0361603.1 chromosome partitioning protein [Breznakia pachnodae]